ncbi:MAG: hypothetical protein U9N50_08450 [Pseudomonadota bacterium]|nr:hypothetical protein [Pseudomonadota bacterium]
MKTINKLKPVFHFVLLTGSILMLAGCHGSHQQATAELELPVIGQSVIAPEVLADGSVSISPALLVQHIGTDGVFILSTDNRARFRMVKAGKKRGKEIIISSGLTGMEQILSGPYDSVFDGSPVRVKQVNED